MKATVSKSLEQVMDRHFFEKDTIIFREGDPANYAYIIRRGSVKIVKENEFKQSLLTTLVANQMFGELALIDGKPRSATAIAAEPTEVLRISPEQFKARIGRMDNFMKHLVNHLIARIYDLSSRIAT